MSPVRVRLSAFAVVATMVLTFAAPLFAVEMEHPFCLAKQHDCDKTAQLKACCCLTQGDRSDDSTPAAAKAQVAPPTGGVTVIVISVPLVRLDLPRHARALTSPPRSSPPDLVTLFGTFLI